MPYVIQNIATGKYAKHSGSDSLYPFFEVKDIHQATEYPSLDHAQYVAFWNLDHFEKWRVIDVNEKLHWIQVPGEGNRWKLEKSDVSTTKGKVDLKRRRLYSTKRRRRQLVGGRR